MNHLPLGLIAFAFCLISFTPATACPQSHDLQPCTSIGAEHRAHGVRAARSAHTTGYDGRPRRWCGWYLRQRKGIADRRFNLAHNWSRWGSPTQPRAGAVVVWRSHVGEIVSYQGGCTAVVHSGNDDGAVRTRERNICNAIAFRG
jgi:hypothetical protein